MHFTSINNPADQSPIDMALVYQHLRLASPGIDTTAVPPDDELIKLYLNIAIDYVEQYTGVPMTTKTVWMHYDSVDDGYGFLLRYPTNETEITSLKYRNSDNEEINHDISEAWINNDRIPNEVKLKEALPSGAHSITIEYEVSAVTTPMYPVGIQAAVLLLAGHYYDNRSPVGAEKFLEAINNILKPYILKWHG